MKIKASPKPVQTETSTPEQLTQEVKDESTPEVISTLEEVSSPELDASIIVEPETKEEPVKEEEPIKEEVKMPVPLAKPEKTTLKNEAPEKPVSIEVKFMKEYISAYKTMIKEPLPNAANCGEALVRILRYAVTKQNSTEVLDELYVFFNELKDSFLSPHKALSSVASLNKVTRDRVQIVYMLMYELVKGSKGPFDFEYAAQILGGAGFVTYISSRLKK